MINFEDISLLDCPLCGGGALLQEEYGWCCYVSCTDCDAHTVEMPFRSEEEKHDAAVKAAELWNMGKVISGNPNE